MLFGVQFRYHAIVDRDEKNRLAIVRAFRGNLVSQERQKDDAFRPSLSFRIGKPIDPHAAKQILFELENGAAAFVADLRARETLRREQRLLAAWEGILKAKSRLEKERRRGLSYKSIRRNGNRISFESP